MTGVRHIVAVHGGRLLPDEARYRALWLRALEAGLSRDWPKAVPLFADTTFTMPWYGDKLAELSDPIDLELDWLDRKSALAALSALSTTKAFRRANYERLPGKSALPEFLADVAAPSLQALGLGRRGVEKALPELGAYWSEADSFKAVVSGRIAGALREAFATAESVALIAHGSGAVAAYDALWQLSEELPERKLDLFLTLGAPLANNTVRGMLRGADAPSERRYPQNIFQWINIAAEDDFLCHDKTVADDFAPMLAARKISTLKDHLIYNLSVRYGRSAPGHSSGYLAHPRTAERLADWLASDTGL